MKNLAILVSGSGSNMQRIFEAIQSQELKNCVINCVIADRDCHALDRSLDNDVETYLIERSENLSKDLDEIVEAEIIDVIILAGFLTILSEEFTRKWEHKIINIHPSLLPKYGGIGMYGKHVHQAVLDNNEKESGASVHYVTHGVDEGAVILQDSFIIEEGDDVVDLQRKVALVEHKIYVEAIDKIVNN